MKTGRTCTRAFGLRHWVVYSSMLALTCVAMPVGAANIAYDATLGAGHSDNIRRSSINEEDENIASATVRFSVDERTARMQADAVGSFAYAEYLENTFDSELLGNFAGNARFGILPQRIEWVASDNYGQVLNDPFAPATPDNRENINYFTTGPDLTAAFGSKNRLRLSARYALTTYEDSPLDSDTKSAELAYLHLLSSASTASVHALAQQIEYNESALDADYDQYEAFGRYDVTGARTALKVDLGYTKMERDAESESDAGLLFRLEASRRVSASSTASLRAGREFSNSGAAFSAGQNSAPVGLESAPGRQTPEPFTHSYVTAGWNYVRSRTGFSLTAGWSDQSYEASNTLDQTLMTVTAGYRRDLSARTAVTLNAGYTSGDFETQGDYHDVNGRFSFDWQLSRAVSVAATVAHFRRSGDVVSGDYSENQVWLSITYARGEPRTELNGPDFGVDRGR